MKTIGQVHITLAVKGVDKLRSRIRRYTTMLILEYCRVTDSRKPDDTVLERCLDDTVLE